MPSVKGKQYSHLKLDLPGHYSRVLAVDFRSIAQEDRQARKREEKSTDSVERL
jgi:hypothetical protein